MLLKRAVGLTIIVTEDFKKKLIADLRKAMDRVDLSRGQIQFQLDRYVTEVAKSDLQQASQLRERLNEEKQRLTDVRSEMDARLREVEKLEISSEYKRGAIESFVEVAVGDNIYQKLGGTEVVVKDGVVVEVRENQDIEEEEDIPEQIIEP